MALIEPESYYTGTQVRGYRWIGITEADECSHVSIPDKGDKTFMVVGDFGAGGTVTLNGTLIPNPTEEDFLPSRGQHDGQPIALTAADRVAVIENDLYNCPAVAAGTGVLVDVYLLAREDN